MTFQQSGGIRWRRQIILITRCTITLLASQILIFTVIPSWHEHTYTPFIRWPCDRSVCDLITAGWKNVCVQP